MSVVLVLGAETMLARVVSRSLHRAGFTVLAASSTPWPICAYSRYVRRTFTHADPKHDESRFIDDIRRICETQGVDVLLPILRECAVIARHRHLFGPGVRMLLGDAATLADFGDKYRTYEVARDAGLAVPEYRRAADLAADPAALAAFPCPCLAKPVWGWGGYGMHECASPQEVAARITAMTDRQREDYFMQQRMPGDVVCVAMLCEAGQMHACDTFRIVASYPRRHGQSTLRESVRADAAVDALRTLLAHVGWTGPCQADFIIDPVTGTPYLIDINARYWNSLIQSTARGVDFPVMHCRMALGMGDAGGAGGAGDVPGTGAAGVSPGVSPGVSRGVPPSVPPGVSRGAPDMSAGMCADMDTGVSTAWFSRALRGDPALLLRRLFSRPQGQAARGIAAFDDWDVRDPLPFFAWPLRHLLGRIASRVAPHHYATDGTGRGEACRS